jgi:exodeoxyribonuclease VII small subunit
MAEKKTFEKSLAELQKIVEQLEKGDLSLEKSLGLYEKGIGLTRFCQEELSQAKLKIEQLKAGDQDE